MSCDCSSTNTEGSSASFILGEIKRIKLNIYQPKDNAALEGNCDPSRNNIVIPITMVVSDPGINIYDCDDLVTALVTDVPAQIDIVDSKSQIIGVQLSYSVDTSIAPLNVTGNYVAIFNYTVDGSEKFIVPFYFTITTISCLSSSGC